MKINFYKNLVKMSFLFIGVLSQLKPDAAELLSFHFDNKTEILSSNECHKNENNVLTLI